MSVGLTGSTAQYDSNDGTLRAARTRNVTGAGELLRFKFYLGFNINCFILIHLHFNLIAMQPAANILHASNGERVYDMKEPLVTFLGACIQLNLTPPLLCCL